MPRWGIVTTFLLWLISGAVLVGAGVMAVRGAHDAPEPSAADTSAHDLLAEAVPSRPLDLPQRPNEQEAECLALAMYHEARSEPGPGQRAVGHVILNRVADPRYPDSICGVVREGGETPPCQFSWWCDGKPDKPIYPALYDRSRVAAYLLLTDKLEDPTQGATSFHALRVSPYWAEVMESTTTIGNHRFYR